MLGRPTLPRHQGPGPNIAFLGYTRGRHTELAELKVNDVDLDEGGILVMGKGRRERWMPIGATVVEALWGYLQARTALGPRTDNLWVSQHGKPMLKAWVYSMLKQLGTDAGVSVHAHQFRHSRTMNMLRAGMAEEMIRRIACWKKTIPETYYRTLAAEDVSRVFKTMSPADKLPGAAAQERGGRKQGSGGRGRL